MSWDQGYTSPDERAAQDRAAEEARQRARMQPFERRLLDYLGEISASLAKLADVTAARQPAGPICPDCGAEQPIYSSTAAGVDGGVGAESVVAPDSAHPTSQPQ